MSVSNFHGWVCNTPKDFPQNAATEVYWEWRSQYDVGPPKPTGSPNSVAMSVDAKGRPVEAPVEDLSRMVGLYEKRKTDKDKEDKDE